MYTSDIDLPVKRLQLNSVTGTLVEVPKKELFLRGPIPLDWLSIAAHLPGKTLNLAIALWWLQGMSRGKSLRLTRKALKTMNVERDAERKGLARLEQEGLLKVERKPGQRPTISILRPVTMNLGSQSCAKKRLAP